MVNYLAITSIANKTKINALKFSRCPLTYKKVRKLTLV